MSENNYCLGKLHENLIAKKLAEHAEIYRKIFSRHDLVGHAHEVRRDMYRRKE